MHVQAFNKAVMKDKQLSLDEGLAENVSTIRGLLLMRTKSRRTIPPYRNTRDLYSHGRGRKNGQIQVRPRLDVLENVVVVHDQSTLDSSILKHPVRDLQPSEEISEVIRDLNLVSGSSIALVRRGTH
jgi:hypothetical protein